ncbi:MAG: type IV toxin-antitoxin system AbiEi family antitoxin domain-containing protein [Deltaproteobacteria bacterium]|nr:type IV toxin-antitoxin system AbiEi family antitoxin domain-containing protein [Deltaproteobacteria bacterium]
MKFESLLRIAGNEPLFETGLLLAGDVDAADLRRQLSRWVNAGKLVQLRRGLYALAPPYRKLEPHPFVLSNQLARPSYVSLQSALAYHGLIPEAVPVTTAVTSGRPGRHTTPLGDCLYRHLGRALLTGYTREEVAPGQLALLATPEKALLDLVYLTPGGDSAGYLDGLRLQGLERLDRARLHALTAASRKPKLARAARRVLQMARAEAEEYRDL